MNSNKAAKNSIPHEICVVPEDHTGLEISEHSVSDAFLLASQRRHDMMPYQQFCASFASLDFDDRGEDRDGPIDGDAFVTENNRSSRWDASSSKCSPSAVKMPRLPQRQVSQGSHSTSTTNGANLGNLVRSYAVVPYSVRTANNIAVSPGYAKKSQLTPRWAPFK